MEDCLEALNCLVIIKPHSLERLVSAIKVSLSTHIWKRKHGVAFAVNMDELSVEGLCTAQCWVAQLRTFIRSILKKCHAPTSRKQKM